MNDVGAGPGQGAQTRPEGQSTQGCFEIICKRRGGTIPAAPPRTLHFFHMFFLLLFYRDK